MGNYLVKNHARYLSTKLAYPSLRFSTLLTFENFGKQKIVFAQIGPVKYKEMARNGATSDHR